MYKVQFNSISLIEFEKEQDALQFAVSLHIASNVEHNIEVCTDNGFICTLIRR